MTVSFSILVGVFGIASADIPHLFPNFGIFHKPQAAGSIYGPPPTISQTTEFLLPEVILNKQTKQYHYIPPPSTPIVVDDNPQEYLPPHYDLNRQLLVYSNGKEGYVYDKPTTSTSTTSSSLGDFPVDQEVPVEESYDYNPPKPASPTYLPPSNQPEFRNTIAAEELHINIKDMRCMNSANGFFRAIIKVEDVYLGSVPLVDYEPYDKSCDFKLSRNYIAIDIDHFNFKTCGVRDCGNNLCVKLRFPLISGLKSGADNFLTLQCKPQNRIAEKSHSFKMGVTNDIQSRNLGAFARGGIQQPLKTHVELLRKAPNGFTKHLEADGTVQLGEELLLRAHVLTGDGWNFTKLSDVNLQRKSSNGNVQSSINLISSLGCLNPAMKSICPFGPNFDPPLGHRLSFKAVMFQGMRSGDEVVMSIKISGCLDEHDCHVDSRSCSDKNLARHKRNAATENGNEISEVSKISFRVVIPGESKPVEVYDDSAFTSTGENIIIVGSIFGMVGLLSLFGLLIYLKKH
ncbi:hypothetical protein ACFFRR_009546 [Megaselia abdita]